MRAILCHQWGTPDTLTLGETESPTPGPNELHVRVRACGVNFADTLMIAGQYQERPPFPFSPGMEIAGDVLAVGAGVDSFQPGDRIAAVTGHSGFAEEIVTPAATAFPIPDRMPYTVAAAFPVAYGTAHIALTHRGRLQPGESLLVHGAAGGVGLTAVELGRKLGATVIATASSTAKLQLAEAAGAHHLINYATDDFRTQVKALTNGRGADVIFDPVGGDVFDQSLRCINWEGRLLIIGFASGRIPQIPANIALVKNCSAVGVYWGAYARRDPATLVQSLQTLLGWYSAGELNPHISQTFPLDQTSDALNQLLNRQSTGKLVITP